MAQFGICTTVERSGEVKAAGWDFVEECVQTFLEGQTPDAQWKGMERVHGAALPVPALSGPCCSGARRGLRRMVLPLGSERPG